MTSPLTSLQHVVHRHFMNRYWHLYFQWSPSHTLTPGNCMCTTLWKQGANSRLGGRLEAAYIGTLKERHSKSEVFTTQLAHDVFKSYQPRPSTRFSLCSHEWIMAWHQNKQPTVVLPHEPLHLAELSGRKQERKADRKKLRSIDDKQRIYIQLGNPLLSVFCCNLILFSVI